MTSKTITLTKVAIMSALLCAICPIIIPLGIVPISLATLFIMIFTYIFGSRMCMLSIIIYILLGAIGIPVFSGYTGGIHILIGPTGGYILGYLLMCLISGTLIKHLGANMIFTTISFICGNLALYCIGTIYLSIINNLSYSNAILTGVVPFIIPDLIKIILASIMAPRLKSRLLPFMH